MFCDRRFWILYLGLFLFVICLRFQTTQKIQLPEAAHNTVGDIPILEQADDGYISSIGEDKYEENGKAIYIHYGGASAAIVPIDFHSGNPVSCSYISFSSSNVD